MIDSFRIEPATYKSFEHEEDLIRQCQEWGLLTSKATKAKSFHYKGHGLQVTCSVVGLVDPITAVIAFENGETHCIHPAYLKEMQAASFGTKSLLSGEPTDDADAPQAGEAPAANQSAPSAAQPESDKPQPAPKPAATITADQDAPAATKAAKKAKPIKLQLPEEKVKMTAVVQEFSTVPNHFSDNDDEVIVYEQVRIVEPEMEVGTAWSSHSATLKKMELEVGDILTFEAKIIAKKLAKHPVPYKINNPAKLQKSKQDA